MISQFFNNFLSSVLVNPLIQPLQGMHQSHHAGSGATQELGLINSTLATLPRHHGNPAHHQTYWELCDRAYELNRLLKGANHGRG